MDWTKLRKKRERPKPGGIPPEFLASQKKRAREKEQEAARAIPESSPESAAEEVTLGAMTTESTQAESVVNEPTQVESVVDEPMQEATDSTMMETVTTESVHENTRAPVTPGEREIANDMFRLVRLANTSSIQTSTSNSVPSAPVPAPAAALQNETSTSVPSQTIVHGWREVNLPNAEYVPEFGTVLQLGLVLEPLPPTKDERGRTVAVNFECGRGKSYVFRVYMNKILQENPRARILLMSANIIYGTSLAHELKQAGFDVAFYKNKDSNLTAHQVVVCSLESFHHLDGQSFDMLLIDEIRTISGIVGGETMPHFPNLFRLRNLCNSTPRVVVCDADLKFTSNESEPNPVVHDMLRIISEDRHVLCVNSTHPGPSHLKRKVRLFHKHKMARFGQKQWEAEIKRAAKAWHDNHEHRFAICVSTRKKDKSHLKKMAALLDELKVPFKTYSGGSGRKSKVGLNDPDAEWTPLGAILFTTTLSIGVDPKYVQFACVFVWAAANGCSVLTQAQAAMRFGRAKEAPLLDPTICILIDGPTPEMRKAMRENKPTEIEELPPPSFDV